MEEIDPGPVREPNPNPIYDEAGHELDETGQPIHVDVDPVIPTGICRHCPRG